MKRWPLIFLIAALAGCVRYEPRPLAPVQIEKDFRARSMADEGLRAFVERNLTNAPSPWPPKEFDLKLLTLVAFYYHPDLDLARSQIALARAGEVKAGERPNPTVSVLPEYSINPDVGVTPWIAAINWDIPLETAGKRKHRLSEAQELTLSARLGLAESAWKIRSRLRASLVEKFAAERELSLLREELEIHVTRVSLIRKRLELGEISRLELNGAETDLLSARIAVRKAETRVADAALTLGAALGLTATALDGTRLSWPDFEKPTEVDGISQGAAQSAGLLNRLDVRRSLRDYAAAEAALRLEVANQYPDVHLSPGYQFDQGQHKFMIGPSLALPIFNQNEGAIAQAEARRREAAAKFSSLQAQAIQETERAVVHFHAAMAEWDEADRMIRELQDRLEQSTRRAVELGEADRLTLLNVRLQKAAAVRARLDALTKVQLAIGALEDAVQRPISGEDDLHLIDALSSSEAQKRTKTK